jgi:hypothetical protein
MRRAEFLQWFGLFAAALVWTGQHVVGFGVTVANCAAGGSHWGISVKTWELALLGVGVAFALLAEAAAVRVVLATRGVEEDGPPPHGRRYFFAVAAVLANVLFLAIILMDGLASITFPPCRPA